MVGRASATLVEGPQGGTISARMDQNQALEMRYDVLGMVRLGAKTIE